MPNILIVDDELGIRESLKGILEDEGYKPALAGSAEACLDEVRTRAFDVILLDVWLPGMDGLDALEQIREMEDPPEVIMISGHGTIETAVRATKLGAFDFLEKPLSLEKTLIVLKNALQAKRLRSENRDLKRTIAEKRHRGREHSDESASPADWPDGAHEWTRADIWRIWHGERVGRSRHPRPKPPQGRNVRGSELRRDSGRPD